MYRVNHIFELKDRVVKKYTKDELSLEELKNKIRLNISFYIGVKDDTITYYDTNIGVNFSLLLLETPFNNCTTWLEVETILSDMWIKSYKTKIPGYNANGGYRKSLKAYYINQFLETKDGVKYKWKVDYFDHREWDTRSIPTFKAIMPDLLLEGPNWINHKNCVVVCNGHILHTQPIEAMDNHGEQLLVKDGARHLWSTTSANQPDVICLDFSDLGNISIYPFSDFKEYNIDYDGKKDMQFVFKDIDLSNYTPVVIMAGSIFFPNELDKNTHVIKFNPVRCPISDILAKKAFDTFQYVEGTPLYEFDTTGMEYLTNYLWEKECNDSFIILIDKNDIFVEKHPDYQFATHRLGVDKYEKCGILRHRETCSILGYIDSKYHKEHLLYTGLEKRLWRLNELVTDKSILSTKWPCLHTNRLYMDKFVGSDNDRITTQHISTLDMMQLIS